ARNLPRAIIVAKMDSENVVLKELLEEIREEFGPRCIPVQHPNATGHAFATVADLLGDPAKVPVEGKESRQAFLEAVVEGDEALMNDYLEEKPLDPARLRPAVRLALKEGRVVPVLFAAAEADKGVAEALDFLATYLPSAAEGPAREGKDAAGAGASRKPSVKEPFSAQVFRTVTDPYVRRLAYLRVVSGKLAGEANLYNARLKKTVRIPQFLKPFGREMKPSADAVAGDILAVAKLEEFELGDTLSDAKSTVEFAPIAVPTPMVSLAVEPKSRADEQKLSQSLALMAVEDPTFRVSRDTQTLELVVTGMTTLHVDVVLSRLKSRFAVQVNTKEPKIPYRETITGKAEGHHKHKKQTGGHGQYGEVFLRLEPKARGEGFEFADEVKGGTIPRQYIPGVEKGIRETLARGVIAGYHVTDVRAAVFYGSYHDVDSSEASFKIAGSRAFQEGFKAAKPVLIEPIVKIEITIPNSMSGAILGDLNGRRGRIQGMDTFGKYQTIKAEVPLAEVATYATDLRTMTGGQGDYRLEPSHYDVVPHKTAEAIIAKSKKPDEEKEEE
ncbi:MAG: elongation factor G, partial [Planctomycetota bacterium]